MRRAAAAALMWLGALGVTPVRGQESSSGARPRPAASWTLGSPADLVRRIEGDAARVDALVSLGYQTWHYGAGWVRLAYAGDTVIGWSNPEGRLAVVFRGGADSIHVTAVARDATLASVLRARGTPEEYLPDRLRGTVLLRYGRIRITVDAMTQRVLATVDPGGVGGGDPGVPSRAAPAAPRWPATLHARVALVSTGDQGRVEADDVLALDVTVTNTGPGVARALHLEVHGTGAAMQPPAVVPSLDSLAAGASQVMPLVLRVADVPRDTVLSLEIGVREGQRFDLDPPMRVQIPLRPARAPRLVLAAVAVDDPSGDHRIGPREVVDLMARVQNTGVGTARDVRVRIVPGAGVHLATDPGEQTLGRVPPGASHEVRFSAFSDSRARGFPVTLEVREARARFDTSLALPLTLNRPVASAARLLRPGEEPSVSAASTAPLISPVDTGVPRAPLRPGTLAVVLGVERYSRAPDALFAERDARAFRQYAQNLFGTGDDASRLFYATNEEVSRSALHKLFDPEGWLARRTDASTDVVVFIAAHGTVDGKTRMAYLLPSDADPAYPAQTGMPIDSLLDRLGALPARSITVLLDACFSGTTRDGTALVPWARDVGVSIEHPALKYPHLVLLTASGSGEVAMGWSDQRHGLFTYWLLTGLRGGADADRDGVVDAGELGAFVARHVAETAQQLGREQTPRLFTRDRRAPLVHLP